MFLAIPTQRRSLVPSFLVPCVFAVSLSACYSTVRTTQNVAHNPNEYARPTRPATECAAEIAAARQDTTYIISDPVTKTYGPHLITVAQPDFSKAPASLRGKTAVLRMQVDENGDVIPRSIQITGVNDGNFVKELRNTARSFRYFPAVRNGCAVAGWSLARYTLGQSSTANFPDAIR